MTPKGCKRLAEADFPIAEESRQVEQIGARMNVLAGERYWLQFTRVPGFVDISIASKPLSSAAVDPGRSLIEDGPEKTNAAYNSAVESLETRLLPAARKFKNLGAATGAEIPALSPVETTPRALAAPEVKEDDHA